MIWAHAWATPSIEVWKSPGLKSGPVLVMFGPKLGCLGRAGPFISVLTTAFREGATLRRDFWSITRPSSRAAGTGEHISPAGPERLPSGGGWAAARWECPQSSSCLALLLSSRRQCECSLEGLRSALAAIHRVERSQMGLILSLFAPDFFGHDDWKVAPGKMRILIPLIVWTPYSFWITCRTLL